MAPTQQLTARLEDCSILDSIIHASVKAPIAEFMALLKVHAESDCAECAAIAKTDQLLELEAEAVSQPDNVVTAEERAALDAEELALFALPARKGPQQARLFPHQEVA